MLKTLKNRNFSLIIGGKLISLMGDSVFEIAIMWHVLSQYGTGSGSMLALIVTMSILPKVVFGSIVGSVVDRYNRKHVMILSDLIAGTAVLGVYLLMQQGEVHKLVLLTVTALLSVSSTTVRIAANSMIPDLFEDKALYDANGLSQFVERGTALLGYALGGALTAMVGVQNAILLNAVSFLFCALIELFLQMDQLKSVQVVNTRVEEEAASIMGQGKEEAQRDINKEVLVVVQRKGLSSDVREVWNYLSKNPGILRIVLVFTAVNFLLDPLLNIVMPFVMKNTFHATSYELGLAIASLPAGFCIGAIYFSRRPEFLMNPFVLHHSILGVNVMSIGLLLIFGMPAWFSGHSLSTGFLMMCLLIQGIFSSAINISTSAYLQKTVPEGIRGKFMGVSSSLSAGLVPLGSILAGMMIGLVAPSVMITFVILAIFGIVLLVPKHSYSFDKIV